MGYTFTVAYNYIPVVVITWRIPTDTIPIYVYQPTGVATRDAPIVVYFHGGGMVLGSRDSCEDACMGLSLYVY